MEKREHNVVQDMREENDTSYKSSRNKETSTNEEQSKQEVRPALFPFDDDRRRRKRSLFFPQWGHLRNYSSNCIVQDEEELY